MSWSVTVNPNVVEMEYAVRGPIPQRAAALKLQGMKTIPCNIGNPQALGQAPITYYRQILSLLEEPARIPRERKLAALLQADPSARAALGDEAWLSPHLLDTAEQILDRLETGMGAYTDSKGPLFVREAVARFIDQRDGPKAVPSEPEQIFLTNGASEGAKYIIDMLIAQPSDGIMIPIPQYPLYSASIRKAGGVQVGYHPHEEQGWTLTKNVLDDAHDQARRQGVTAKAIVVINPGNPTGAILDEASVRQVIELAAERNLAIIADEVYQENVYGGRFVSFARVLAEMGAKVPLFSLHSTSKGFYGECGHRGGYLEVRNPPGIEGSSLPFLDVVVKQASVCLCSNTAGQLMTYMMVTPPAPGSPPHARFMQERQQVLDDLFAKAKLVKAAFAEMDGVDCYGEIGAMYLFPKLGKLPAGTNDFDYCMRLLEETGLCTVNGSGFGQRPGTHHLRFAFLPPRSMLQRVLPQWIAFHNRYVNQ